MKCKKLKPCDCGGEAAVKLDHLLSNSGWGKSYFSYWVECTACGKRSKHFNTMDQYDPREQAVEDWNGRPEND